MPAIGIGISPVLNTVPGIGGYAAALLATSPIAYWRCNQSTGIAVADSSGNNSEAKATGVTWTPDASPEADYAAYFDGINDGIDGDTNSADSDNGLKSRWNSLEGSLLMWLKVPAGAWTNGVLTPAIRINTSGDDEGRLIAQKQITSNSFRFFGTGISNHTRLSFSPSGFFPVAATWSASNNRLRYWIGDDDTMDVNPYIATERFGNTLDDLFIGISGATFWEGFVVDVALWSEELSQTVMESLFTR